jgi:hypothetical protein
MADVALIFGFGHRDLCAMDLQELARWRDRAGRVDEARRDG